MPLTRIVCPHCEQSMELVVTSVTRSRDCQNCGRSIILQTAARDGKQPRKAVLMPATGPLGNEGALPGFAGTEPQRLTGNAMNRMAHDPGVRRTAILFKCGMAFFGALLLAVLFWDKLFVWFGVSNTAVRAPRGSPDSVSSDPIAGSPAQSRPEAGPELGPRAKSERESPEVVDPLVGPRERGQQRALKGALAFLNAATVEERLTRVRDRHLVENRMRSYYEREGDGPISHERVEPLEVNPEGPFTYTFNVIFRDGTRRKILMGKSSLGEYLADWGSFVVYSEMSWNEFRAGRPRIPTLFRVLADREEFFGGEFADPETYICVRLTYPKDPDAPPIYGYATRSSSIGHTLKFVMETGREEPVPLILKLSYPAHGETDNQVWINEFIGEGWLARNW